jgi:sugar phosphate isomerase/epimerase
MKLGVSNIAWRSEDDALAAGLLNELGFAGVEVAPTRVWERPLEVLEEEARRHRRFWNERGIEVVALQALLFGRPDLTLFATGAARSETLEYLRGLMRLGEWLGARVLVFGAPKNRRLSGLDPDAAFSIAVDFFRAAGASAREHGVVLAIEPNPPQYDCDFVTTSEEALELVRRTGDEGFGLHLDAAAMTLAGESPAEAIAACAGSIAHFHVSEPQLGPIGSGGVDHAALASALRAIGYPNWKSIEMRAAPVDTEGRLRKALRFVLDTYGGAS